MATNQGEGRRMRQTAAELGARREALEAAGREEWDRATREGRNVQARTLQELLELGARALARKAGKAGGLDEAFMSGRGDRVTVTAAQADEDELVRPESQVAFEPTLNERVQGSPGSRLYMRLYADWDPARSNGVTALPSDEVLDAGEKYKRALKAKGDREPVGFFVRGKDGALTLQAAKKVKSRSSDRSGFAPAGYSATARPPGNELAAAHGHPNGAAGFLDNPEDGVSHGYGDSGYLRSGKPMGAVYRGEVGWHGLENGRRVFIFPTGTMSDADIAQMQKNLNNEQQLFYKK